MREGGSNEACLVCEGQLPSKPGIRVECLGCSAAPRPCRRSPAATGQVSGPPAKAHLPGSALSLRLLLVSLLIGYRYWLLQTRQGRGRADAQCEWQQGQGGAGSECAAWQHGRLGCPARQGRQRCLRLCLASNWPAAHCAALHSHPWRQRRQGRQGAAAAAAVFSVVHSPRRASWCRAVAGGQGAWRAGRQAVCRPEGLHTCTCANPPQPRACTRVQGPSRASQCRLIEYNQQLLYAVCQPIEKRERKRRVEKWRSGTEEQQQSRSSALRWQTDQEVCSARGRRCGLRAMRGCHRPPAHVAVPP